MAVIFEGLSVPELGGHDEAGLWVESVALAYEIYNVG